MTRPHPLLLLPLLLAACLDPAAERTTVDFEQTGRADLGELRARIDQGVATFVDPAARLVRFRANAPAVRFTLASAAAEAHTVRVEVVNVFPDVATDPVLPVESLGPKAVAFEVAVPAGGERQIALARPGADAARPFRFAWVGDVQGGLERFAQVRARIDADPSIELVLFAGDDTSRGQPEEIDDFVAAADALAVPWYTLLGNHEAMGDVPYFQRTVGRINTAFDYRGARFVLADGASGTLDERVHAWLEERLGADGPALRVTAMHVPPFDTEGLRDGGFNSRAEAAKTVSTLADGGADLLLCGHLHTLRFSGAGGVPTVVSGAGGVDFTMRLDGSDLHYLAVDADPAREALTVGVAEVR